MNPHRMAVESAKRMVDLSHPELLASMGTFDLLDVAGRLRGCLEELIEVAEGQPKSARLRLQHDDEFKNLARAVRMDLNAMKNSFGRVDRLLDALTGMVEPKNGGGDE
ncbi:hypothetical protein [Streptomyces asiaticus]|uniref:hypothetical protein n=1 Tax=Streptomyces asiaticus TaxID=114695 RepID=UPI003F66CDDE